MDNLDEEENAPDNQLFDEDLDVAEEIEIKPHISPQKLPPLLAGLLNASTAPTLKCVSSTTDSRPINLLYRSIPQLLASNAYDSQTTNNSRIHSAGVVTALENLYSVADTVKLTEELTQHYPEPQGLRFLNPEPLGDAEAHLKTSKLFFALKADSCLVKLADVQALLARPLADLLSYLAETANSPLDATFVAERLTDMAKTLVVSAKINEAARIDLACAAFKVPTSAAKTERGSSLLGSNFARNVERLRKDKKVLTGDTPPTSNSQQRQRFHPYSRGSDQPSNRNNWRPRPNGQWNNQQTSRQAQQQTGPAHNTSRGNPGPSNNSNQTSGKVFRSISDNVSQWQDITSDVWILSTVEGYTIPFQSIPQQTSPPNTIRFSASDTVIANELVADLLRKGAIRPIRPDKVAFLSNLFLVAKKGTSKFRPVINLKALNRYIPDNKFKMEGWSEVKEAVFPNCYFARIDLQDAFLSINVHKSSQPYLAFTWGDRSYCWTRLPFGLKTSPRVFTKLLKPVVATLRQEGITLIVYLDDFLLIGDTPSRVLNHVKRTTQLLHTLGYTVNYEKSVLTPTQNITFLGYNLDSVAMRLSLPPNKLMEIKESINSFLTTSQISLRALSTVLGKLTALTTVVRSVRYHCTGILQQFSSITKHTRNFDSIINLPHDVRTDLLWWLTNLEQLATGPISPPLVSMEITTDSSLQGWGAWCDTTSTGGAWSQEDSNLHINALELKAILIAVQRLAAHQTNTTIAIRTDNTNAMHCINNFGSIRSTILNSLSRQLWAWAFQRNVFLKATYLPGSQNVLADTLSRAEWDNHSFSLHPSIFQQLNTDYGPFDIDLFADFSNYKVDTYLSWAKDPFAHGCDAFTYRWDEWPNLYAFPPFKLVDRCLSYLDSFPHCEMTLICPFWPTQPSFPRLLQRSIACPRLIPSFDDLLLDPKGQPHPLLLSHKLQLIAWRIAPLACQTKRHIFWTELSAIPQKQHTKHAGDVGRVGPQNEISLPLLHL